MELEDQWQQFISGNDEKLFQIQEKPTIEKMAPEPSQLIISTKSKIIYLNRTFYLNDLFWKLRTIPYDEEREGIVKKQMKFNFLNKNEVNYFEKMIQHENNIKIKILNQIDNPNGRIIFKDVRKVDVGFCKNDVLKPNKESKSAFYNCFVIIFRKMFKKSFREFHIKLFNSGKVEIPGILSNEMLESVIHILLKTLQPHFSETICEIKEKRELVLVNSNFNCNYYINRNELVHLLKTKYNVKCNMDSCSYPGIQCKYKLKNDKEVSYMIFRTGSVLIVGKCEDDELDNIYNFLTNIFREEYQNICEKESDLEKKEKEKKMLKKTKPVKKSLFILKNV